MVGSLLSTAANGMTIVTLHRKNMLGTINRADLMVIYVLTIPGFSCLGMIGLEIFTFREMAIPLGVYFSFVAILASESPHTSLNINCCNILFSLDPSVGNKLNKVVRQLKPGFVLVGILMCSSVIGMAFSTSEVAVDASFAMYCAACAGQLMLQMIPEACILASTIWVRDSVRAYLDEYPVARQAFQKLKNLKLVAFSTLLLHIPGFILLFYFRRFAGLIQACLLASAMPLCIYHGTVSHHHKSTAKKVETAFPRHSSNCISTHIQRVIDACTEDQVDMQTPNSHRGVSLEFLKAFTQEYKVSKSEKTWEVCNRLNKPHCARLKCAYFSMLKAGRFPGSNRPWTGIQNVFVSHTWGCSFRRLVATLEHFEASQSQPGTETEADFFYYIDIFCLNQHEFDEPNAKLPSFDIPQGGTFEEFMLSTLDSSIQKASSVLVAVDQFDDPLPLGRIWCLYEMWRAIELGTHIRMGFLESEATLFAKAVQSDEVDVEKIAKTKVDVAKATVTMARDLSLIREKIRTSIGEESFNTTLRTKLMAHLVYCAIQERDTNMFCIQTGQAADNQILEENPLVSVSGSLDLGKQTALKRQI